ncbi:MAG: hypothetical protein JWL90_2147 [Chthoniobacteraceae bacterium]|nr:hypothetical protein [Chthoniobacteraceae bacterium]
MKLKTRSLSILATLILPVSVFAGNSSVIRSPLENTAVDSDAFGTVVSMLQSSHSLFAIELGRLDAKQNYSLKVGQIVEALFTTDSKGRARLRFSSEVEKNKPLLDFDPRGKTVAVLDANGVAVLQAVISSEGEPVGVSVDERANLLAATGAKSKGAARYTARKSGRRTFEIAVSGPAAAGLHVYVDGIDRGEVESHGRTGRVEFSSEPKVFQSALDFDPRGAQIDMIDAAGFLQFSGKLEAKAKGVNMATRATKQVLIASTGADPDGQALASLRVRDDARKDFSVELENVPEGVYELLVNGIVQGTITVTARAAGGTEGEVEFSGKADDDAHELPLTFDPVGATLSVRQGTTVFFTSLFNPGSGLPVPDAGALISEVLASTGLDANASGEVEFSTQSNGEMEFEVEIEDVDAGAYQLFVGGTLRGTISAVPDANSRVRGKLKFEKEGVSQTIVRSSKRGGGGDDAGGDDHGGGGGGSDDPAGDDHGGGTGGGNSTGGGAEVPKAPLTFDPRGQLIEIRNAARTFFSHVLGDGSAAEGSGMVTVPGEIAVALISTGADPDATAHAEWERNDRGSESFEVEVEDLAAGSYEVLVGEIVRGSVTVVAAGHGTRGKIRFNDKPGDLALDFDPFGQTITLRKEGVIYFQRTFPSGS